MMVSLAGLCQKGNGISTYLGIIRFHQESFSHSLSKGNKIIIFLALGFLEKEYKMSKSQYDTDFYSSS